jgi:hypothetical protein
VARLIGRSDRRNDNGNSSSVTVRTNAATNACALRATRVRGQRMREMGYVRPIAQPKGVPPAPASYGKTRCAGSGLHVPITPRRDPKVFGRQRVAPPIELARCRRGQVSVDAFHVERGRRGGRTVAGRPKADARRPPRTAAVLFVERARCPSAPFGSPPRSSCAPSAPFGFASNGCPPLVVRRTADPL